MPQNNDFNGNNAEGLDHEALRRIGEQFSRRQKLRDIKVSEYSRPNYDLSSLSSQPRLRKFSWMSDEQIDSELKKKEQELARIEARDSLNSEIKDLKEEKKNRQLKARESNGGDGSGFWTVAILVVLFLLFFAGI